MYEITVDNKGKKFLGITIDQDYQRGKVRISMPSYVEKTLKQFNHIAKGQKQHSPHPWSKPTYGQTTQYTR